MGSVGIPQQWEFKLNGAQNRNEIEINVTGAAWQGNSHSIVLFPIAIFCM